MVYIHGFVRRVTFGVDCENHVNVDACLFLFFLHAGNDCILEMY